jgi:hypothetical protein
MSRLIVSGCSFTNYFHPTWAWFLSSAYDETYNYGQAGAGNEYIYHSIVDADTDLHLNKDDTVVIAWSGYYRFDRFAEFDERIKWGTKWKTNGDWSHDPKFKTLEQFVNNEGWIRKSINYIASTARYLKSKNIKYVFTSLYDLNIKFDNKMHADPYIVKLLADIKNDNFIYAEGLSSFVFNYRKQTKSAAYSSHPNLREHQLLASGIAAKLGVTIDTHTDLQQYDTLIDSSNQEVFGKILPLLDTKNYARILTTTNPECLSATIEKYYPTTMQEYKKVAGSLLIK